MGIITKSASKYKYVVSKNSKNYNPFFDGLVWTAENIDNLPGYVKLSSVERYEDDGSSAISKKIVTVPLNRLMRDFTKVCKQDITPEFKKNESGANAGPRERSIWEFCEDDDVPAENDDSDEDEDGGDEWWSNGEIEKFMRNYDVDHSLLWTDNEIRDFTKQCSGCSVKESDVAVDSKPSTDDGSSCKWDGGKCPKTNRRDVKNDGRHGRGKSESDPISLLKDAIELLGRLLESNY